jgi:carbonic anhydrase
MPRNCCRPAKEQLAAFKTLYRMNARPVQPLNGRKIIDVNV